MTFSTDEQPWLLSQINETNSLAQLIHGKEGGIRRGEDWAMVKA